MAALDGSRSAGNIAFTYPDFTVYEVARFLIEFSLEMQSVAVGWQVYEITKRPLDLGLVGLAQFLPGILLFLVTGHLADRFDRRKLLMLCYCGFVLCSGLLLEIALRGAHDFHISALIADVVCGGDVDAGSLVSEEYLMALERKHFCGLLDHPKTQERIMGMLQTGKPVRN